MINLFRSLIWDRWLAHVDFDVRGEEYGHALEFLAQSKSILDVACGTGTFLEVWAATGKPAGKGLEFNPENVAYARERGLDVDEGSALELPYDNDSFDGLHCSHLMQVFDQDQAQQFVREANRVVKHEGVIVITTLNWFSRFFRHPENTRPYPPDALWRYALQAHGATSPMYAGMPAWRQEGIWFRRPPLLEMVSFSNLNRNSVYGRLNALQLKLGLRRFWAFDAYTIKLRVYK